MNALITTLLLSNFGGITYETIDFLRAINIDYGYQIYLMHHSSTQVVLWFVNECTMRVYITLDRIIPAPGRGSPTHIDCKSNKDSSTTLAKGSTTTNSYKYEVHTSTPKPPSTLSSSILEDGVALVSIRDISEFLRNSGTELSTLETLVPNSRRGFETLGGFDNICTSNDRDWIVQYISTRFY